jgi:hypothetical protein
VIPAAARLLDGARAARVKGVYSRAAFQPGYPDLVANIPLLTDVAQYGCLIDGTAGAAIIDEVAPHWGAWSPRWSSRTEARSLWPSFQLPDSAKPRASHPCPVNRGHFTQSRFTTSVDAVLTPPHIDRLGADPEISRHVGHCSAGLDQVQHLAPALRRYPRLPTALP